MTQLDDNKDLILRWFAALSEGRFEDSAELMDPEGEYWVLRGRATMPIATFPAVIAGHATRTFVDGVRFEPGVMTAEDDRVSVRVDGFATLRSDGTPFDNSYHYLFSVRGGLIRAVWEYGDTYMSWKAFGGVNSE